MTISNFMDNISPFAENANPADGTDQQAGLRFALYESDGDIKPIVNAMPKLLQMELGLL